MRVSAVKYKCMKVGSLVTASGMGRGIILEVSDINTQNILVCWTKQDLFGYPPFSKTWEDARCLTLISEAG